MNSDALPRNVYAERLAERSERLRVFMRRRNTIGNIRLLVALAAAAVVWYAFHGFSIWWIAGPVALFVALVWGQSRVERQAECVGRAVRFYEQGIARLENRWHGNGERGDRFTDPHHPY